MLRRFYSKSWPYKNTVTFALFQCLQRNETERYLLNVVVFNEAVKASLIYPIVC